MRRLSPLSLTAAMESAGVTRHALAQAVGVDQSSIWRWTTDQPEYAGRQPTAGQLDRVAEALNLDDSQVVRVARHFRVRAEVKAS